MTTLSQIDIAINNLSGPSQVVKNQVIGIVGPIYGGQNLPVTVRVSPNPYFHANSGAEVIITSTGAMVMLSAGDTVFPTPAGLTTSFTTLNSEINSLGSEYGINEGFISTIEYWEWLLFNPGVYNGGLPPSIPFAELGSGWVGINVFNFLSDNVTSLISIGPLPNYW